MGSDIYDMMFTDAKDMKFEKKTSVKGLLGEDII